MEFKAYFTYASIEHQLNIQRWPEQSGVIECMNMTLIERAYSLRLQADISKGLWSEVISYVCYLVKRSLLIAVVLHISKETRRRESVDYLIIKIFGCLAYSRINSQKRYKLESWSKKCIYIGFTKSISNQGMYFIAPSQAYSLDYDKMELGLSNHTSSFLTASLFPYPFPATYL